MQTLWQDLRYATRLLRKSPGFAAVAILTLAVAIGANAVVFSVLNALILRPLNVPDAQSLYVLGRGMDRSGKESYPNYIDLRDRNHSFEDLVAYNIDQIALDTGKNSSRVWAFEVSGNYFDALHLQPHVGRFFHASDEQGPNSAPYIVLAYSYWHSHFQDDPGVLGRTVQLNKRPFTIVGVGPHGFHGTALLFTPDFFVPIINQEQIDGWSGQNARGNRWMDGVIGHLKPGVTPTQAMVDLNAIGSDLQKSYPKEDSEMTFTLVHEGFGGDSTADAIQAFVAGLMLLAALILLAACANLGSLFAARAADRSREVALRLALGAPRGRILRQLFTEAVLISLLGGAVGLWASVILLQWLSTWNPFSQYPLNMPVSPDANVYGVALLLSLASGLLFGAVPVRQVLRTDPYQIVKSGSTAVLGRRITVRDLLLAVQIAICAVLVTSSMVAVQGLARSLHSNFGFDPRDAMLVDTDLRMAGYTDDKAPAMQRRMIDAMHTIPGVTSVGLVSVPPSHVTCCNSSNIFTDSATDLTPSNVAAAVATFATSPEYFQAARTALLSGRIFTWHDDKNAPRVALINQVFARKVFGSPTNAIGHSFRIEDGTRIQVVGILEDGKYTADVNETPQPAMFLPFLQTPSTESWLVLRSNGNPQQLAAAIRTKLHSLDAGLPPFVQTWNEEMNIALFPSRMAAASLGVLGMMGAMLSITGIFGVAAYSVSKRKRDLGIRMALGAQRKEVLKAALGRAVKLLAFGSAAGLALGLLATRVLAAIVYQASPRDPLVLAGVVLAMSLLGLLATWIPAHRALSINPALLMREE
jgi:predicted permease